MISKKKSRKSTRTTNNAAIKRIAAKATKQPKPYANIAISSKFLSLQQDGAASSAQANG